MSSEELEEFRRQWRKEVKARRTQHSNDYQQKGKAVGSGFSTLGASESPVLKHSRMPEDPHSPLDNMDSLSLEDESDEADANEELPKEESAMNHYIAAVDSERQGRLGEAINSYRCAVRMDPNINNAYKRHHLTTIASTFTPPSFTTTDVSQATKNEEDTFRHNVPVGDEYIASSATRKDPLEDLIQEFSNEPIEYLPYIECRPVHVAKLPSEIMLHILQHLVLHSVSSVTNFALACKTFFLLTRQPALWRFGCDHAFKTPYMTMKASRRYQAEYVDKVYGRHWMRMFIERPRIRYDGVYISACHYIRTGSNENRYNQPDHLVTYYRYLRFFPDGRVLKYLSTDDPSQVVNQLNHDFEQPQVLRGYFEQSKGQIYVEMKDRLRSREEFRMTLEIKSTHRGRHNKLQWIEYSSYTDGREEDRTPYDLKTMKPYFFSGVRSYRVGAPFDPSENHVGPLTRRRAIELNLKLE